MLVRNVGKQLVNEAASRTVRLEFSTSNAQNVLRLKCSGSWVTRLVRGFESHSRHRSLTAGSVCALLVSSRDLRVADVAFKCECLVSMRLIFRTISMSHKPGQFYKIEILHHGETGRP